jgi:hydroxymethylglutaryl-CoA reductase
MATVSSQFSNLKTASPSDRLKRITQHFENEDIASKLEGGALSLDLADGMIENVVGKFELPLGVATNFLINGKDYLIPMCVEEPSVVAAASYMAKLARSRGGFHAEADAPIMRAQVQVLGINDLQAARKQLEDHKEEIIALANSKDRTLVSLGGGCQDIEIHTFPDTQIGGMLILHLLVDVRDAMGANTVNTMAEHVSPFVEKLTMGYVKLRILSNLADRRLVRASVEIEQSVLAMGDLKGSEVIKGIEEASVFAEVDPYRAATHNKGIMNGIDPIVVATGNDWRAVEAGAHAYAAKDGRYTSLTTWRCNERGNLYGQICLPMAVGLVGGATKTHPAAQAALRLLDVHSASELAQVIAAVGLAQNLAALRALSTEGIQRGHMKLHAKNIALQAGATGEDITKVVQFMIDSNDITIDAARRCLSTD